MTFRSHIPPYKVPKDTRLTKILKGMPMPNNAFLDKGQCGNGATEKLLTDRTRNILLIVPYKTNVSAICDEDKYSYTLPVYGGKTEDEVKSYLLKEIPSKTIVSTPDSLTKIISAAEKVGMLQELYSDWFIFLDEQHTYLSDDFRDSMLDTLESFYKFNNKLMVSATPFILSDLRVKQLDYHKVEIIGRLGTVNLIEARSINGTLKAYIDDALVNNQRLFIFYNSVTEIRNLCKACNLDITNTGIYCADDTKGKNRETLQELSCLMVPVPKSGEFKIVNMFTTANFESWNLTGESNCKMIVATDTKPYKGHTLVSIDKCVQAFGRYRRKDGDKGNGPELYHVFNHRNIDEYKPLEAFKAYHFHAAEQILNNYKDLLKSAAQHGDIKPKFDERLNAYCRKPKEHLIINSTMVDRISYRMHNEEVYNHSKFVIQQWEKYNYSVKLINDEHKWFTSRDKARISKADQLKHDYLSIINFNEDKRPFVIGLNPVDHLTKSNLLAVKASIHLTKPEMETYKYNVTKVSNAIFLKEESQNKIKMLKIVNLHFKRGHRYSKESIKRTIQSIYNQLELKDKNGGKRTATAKHIALFFDIKDCKITNKKGLIENGFELLRPTFSMIAVN